MPAKKPAQARALHKVSKKTEYLPRIGKRSRVESVDFTQSFVYPWVLHPHALTGSVHTLASKFKIACGGCGKRARAHVPPLRAWEVSAAQTWNSSSFSSVNWPRKRHLLSIHRGKGICCQLLLTRKLSFEPFSDTKTFFRTFLWHENFLSNLSLTGKLSFEPFCILAFSQPIRS
jgi:hypothetical protein